MLFSAGVVAAAPRVVVSIGPIHSLVAGVMRGIGKPDLLIEGGGSPHGHAMRPSQAKLLQAAELIVWIGPALETFLEKPIRSLGSRARIVALINAPKIMLLPIREEMGDTREAAGTPAFNPHIWLSPRNAGNIVEIVAVELSALDPVNAAIYRRNAVFLVERIEKLAAEIETTVAAVKTRPYVVLHDAFQYFENHFGTKSLGAIMLSPDRKPGAKRLSGIRRVILSQGVVCVFGEPQFPSALLRAVTSGTSTRTGILDPIGARLPPGPDAYFTLMRDIAASLVDCLTG